VTDTVNQEEINAMKADLAQFKAEQAKADADRQDKIREKISHLTSRIQAYEQRILDRRRIAESQAKAKAQRLQRKADARPSL
jgi:hypothetical protein